LVALGVHLQCRICVHGPFRPSCKYMAVGWTMTAPKSCRTSSCRLDGCMDENKNTCEHNPHRIFHSWINEFHRPCQLHSTDYAPPACLQCTSVPSKIRFIKLWSHFCHPLGRKRKKKRDMVPILNLLQKSRRLAMRIIQLLLGS
jgi:hypothetical protein